MEITRSGRTGTVEVVLSGRLDALGAERLSAEIDECLRGGARLLRLDLARVGYISSAGVGALVAGYQKLSGIGGKLWIVRPSAAVVNVLETAGLGELVPPPESGTEETVAIVHPVRKGPLSVEVHRIGARRPMTVAAHGDPSWLERSSVEPPLSTVELGEDAVGVGIGALGESPEEARPRFGELLAAGGVAVYLPTDGSGRPDYQLSTKGIAPRAHVLHAAVCRGAFSTFGRFETAGTEAAVTAATPLSALAEAILELAGGEAAAFVVVAESAGLVGASLKRSPLAGGSAESFFAHPGIRERLSLTTERAFPRSLALLAGIAARRSPAGLEPHLRPMGRSGLLGHVHAVALPFRPLPHGVLPLGRTVASLFGSAVPLGFLHLLDDDRDLHGAGESELSRGVLWCAPLEPEVTA